MAPRTPPPRLGISSCLLGAAVRYDGNHKLDTWLRDTLGQVFEFVPICPEVGIGMGVPRPPIRLTGNPAAPRAVGIADPSLDVTDRLAAYGHEQQRRHTGLCGYIFKKNSPSCGLHRVKVYGARGGSQPGRGIYAAAFLAHQPWLPVEEEGRLGDPALRDNFLERVFVLHRWQQLCAVGLTPARLVAFHAAHKYAVLAHSPDAARALGRMVAGAGRRGLVARGEAYLASLMQALMHPATPARHANVLEHLMGYLKKQLDTGDRQELHDAIHDYRRGRGPRAVPLTLLRHHFRRYPNEYVAGQVYLYPDARESLARVI